MKIANILKGALRVTGKILYFGFLTLRITLKIISLVVVSLVRTAIDILRAR